MNDYKQIGFIKRAMEYGIPESEAYKLNKAINKTTALKKLLLSMGAAGTIGGLYAYDQHLLRKPIEHTNKYVQ